MARKPKKAKAAKKKPTEKKLDLQMLGEVVTGPLAPLKHNDWNPNELTAFDRASLKNRFQKKGWLKSHALTVWGTDERGNVMNVIIDGEHRCDIAIDLGFTEGPMVILDGITRLEAEEWTIALDANRGRFNKKKLAKTAAEIVELRGEEDMTLLGMDLGIEPETLQDMLHGDDESGGNDEEGSDDDELPPPPAVPITQTGDLWMLGQHRLLCGDSFKEEDRARLIQGEHVDLVLMDPPYAIYGSSTGIGADIADDKMVRPFFESLFRFTCAVVKEFAHVYVCCDWRSWAAIWEGARAARLSVKNCIVWDKGGGGLGSSYAQTYELIGFFARLPPPTAMKSTTKRGQRMVHAPNIARYGRVVGEDREHNAAKPVDLFAWLMGNSSDEDDLVADFFLGSGTTIIAAEKLKRRCYGMEMEPRYCDVVVKRWERFTGQKATRIPRDKVA